MKNALSFLAAVILAASLANTARSQIISAPPPSAIQLRSAPELDQLLGPIALYPDPLIAEILPAATLPSQIVVADRFLRAGGNPGFIDQQPWDPSVKAVARYPAVLAYLDDNIGWASEIGQAFLYQQVDVMNAIQRLRAQALSLGNLQSTPQQTVVTDNGLIEILPASPEVIYVPSYQPQVVYYERPPRPGFFMSFGVGLPIGLWLNHDFDWRDRHVIVWHHDAPRPRDWWYRRPSERPRPIIIHNDVHVVNRNEPSVWRPHQSVAPRIERGDRGWAPPRETHVTPPVHVPNPAPVRPNLPMPTPRLPLPMPPIPRAPGALIGVHSAQDTHVFSQRGAESRQAINHPAPTPAPHPSAPMHTAPAGGGPRGGGDRDGHR
jgi:hypothetical protein